jgi:hypothetical protein
MAIRVPDGFDPIPTFSSNNSAFATTCPAWCTKSRIRSANAAAASACAHVARFSLKRFPTLRLSFAFSSLNFLESSTQASSIIIFRIRSGSSDGPHTTSWQASINSSPLRSCSACISPRALQIDWNWSLLDESEGPSNFGTSVAPACSDLSSCLGRLGSQFSRTCVSSSSSSSSSSLSSDPDANPASSSDPIRRISVYPPGSSKPFPLPA